MNRSGFPTGAEAVVLGPHGPVLCSVLQLRIPEQLGAPRALLLMPSMQLCGERLQRRCLGAGYSLEAWIEEVWMAHHDGTSWDMHSFFGFQWCLGLLFGSPLPAFEVFLCSVLYSYFLLWASV